MISRCLTNLGRTVACGNACENAFFRFLSSSRPLVPRIRWFLFNLRFPCFDSLSAWRRDVENGQNKRNLERRANQKEECFCLGSPSPSPKRLDKINASWWMCEIKRLKTLEKVLQLSSTGLSHYKFEH